MIKPHDFEEAKQQIGRFADSANTSMGLEKFQVSGGFLDLFDHKVTGAELNSLVTNLQEYLMRLNTRDHDIIQEFGQVYKALESLDKDYIQDILISVKAAETASSQAKTASEQALKAQKDTDRAIEALKATTATLKRFREEVKAIHHLQDVDSLWDKAQSAEKALQEANEQIRDISMRYGNRIEKIEQLRDAINKYKHLKDIDWIWSVASFNQRSINALADDLGAINERFTQEVNCLKSYQEKLEALQHLLDIDEIWENMSAHQKTLAEISEQRSSMLNSIDDLSRKIETIVTSFEEKKEEIGGIREKVDSSKHFDQIDNMWTDIQKAKQELSNLINRGTEETDTILRMCQEISTLQGMKDELSQFAEASRVEGLETKLQTMSEELESINSAASERDKELEEKNRDLKRQFKLLYYIAGSALGITLLQFILHLAGVV